MTTLDPVLQTRRHSHCFASCLTETSWRRTAHSTLRQPVLKHLFQQRRDSHQRSTSQRHATQQDGADEEQQPPKGEWGGWEDWEQDWGDWTEDAVEHKSKERKVRAARRQLRDEYLRPMIDAQGIKQRLGFKREQSEQQVQQEFEENQQESREAVKFAVFLITVPLLAGFCLSRLVADPFFEFVQHQNPQAFAVTDKQKVEGAREVHKEELRLRMDAAIGRAPPLTDAELQPLLRKEALLLVEHFKEKNQEAVLNVISDSTSAITLFLILLKESQGRTMLFNAISRVFGGLSDTAKAFLIIASTDILLGYHSEEGWTAGIRLLTEHYGFEAEEHPIYVFVAIVPVVMDAIFKYWIFVGLNRQDPAAAVTLKSMDRH